MVRNYLEVYTMYINMLKGCKIRHHSKPEPDEVKTLQIRIVIQK